MSGSGGAGGGAPVPAGWLYTVPGETQVRVATRSGGEVWMGRGVNADDLFLCGYNSGLWMASPSAEQALDSVFDALMTSWHPNFVRVSLGMNSYSPVVHWESSDAYAAAMTRVIRRLGSHAGTYVLVALRSDTSMVDPEGNTCGQGDDAVCLPSNDTDAVYRALVRTFQADPFVIFGVANEPGGNRSTNADIRARMDRAVSVIRSEEDTLGVPHHLVTVQGNQWTSNLSMYSGSPLPYDNVVYEYHSYPPVAAEYTIPGLPVIIGEYGPLGTDTSFTTAFYADVEARKIPNLAWSLSPYSNCTPDLVSVTHDASLTTTAWGSLVRAYLQAH